MRASPALCLIFALLAPALAAADEDDIDLDVLEETETASRLQAVAIRALMDENWAVAQAKAEAALALNDDIVTAESRLVLSRALEMQGDLDRARAELDGFLALPLLDSHRARGREAAERVDAKIAQRAARREDDRRRDALRAERSAQWAPGSPLRRRRVGGAVLMASGAAPAIIGAVFVGNDVEHAKAGVRSGTWAAIGAPLLITGLTLEVAGAILAFGPAPPPVVATVGWVPGGGPLFAVGGRF